MSTDTSTLVIEGIDLDADIPCPHSQHMEKHVVEQPAAYRYRFACGHCGTSGVAFICESGWVRLHSGTVRCHRCKVGGLNPFEVITLIERLRP